MEHLTLAVRPCILKKQPESWMNDQTNCAVKIIIFRYFDFFLELPFYFLLIYLFIYLFYISFVHDFSRYALWALNVQDASYFFLV